MPAELCGRRHCGCGPCRAVLCVSRARDSCASWKEAYALRRERQDARRRRLGARHRCHGRHRQGVCAAARRCRLQHCAREPYAREAHGARPRDRRQVRRHQDDLLRDGLCQRGTGRVRGPGAHHQPPGRVGAGEQCRCVARHARVVCRDGRGGDGPHCRRQRHCDAARHQARRAPPRAPQGRPDPQPRLLHWPVGHADDGDLRGHQGVPHRLDAGAR